MGSRVGGFSSCGPWALGHRLCSCGTQALLLPEMWALPNPGTDPVSPASVDGFFTTEPPGKPEMHFFYCLKSCDSHTAKFSHFLMY